MKKYDRPLQKEFFQEVKGSKENYRSIILADQKKEIFDWLKSDDLDSAILENFGGNYDQEVFDEKAAKNI